MPLQVLRMRLDVYGRFQLEVLRENNVGKVVFLQPTPDRGRSTKRLLNMAGNVFPATSTAGWDWFSFGSILSRRLMRNGVTVMTVKRV